jgi:hypothetical protein
MQQTGILTALFLVFTAPLVAQESKPTAGAQSTGAQATAPAPSRPWLDYWRLSTFSFGRVSKDQQGSDFFEAIGTGITVSMDAHTGYIVTAKHVFYDPTKDWHPSEIRVRWAWQEQKTVYEELGSTLALRDRSGRDLWVAAADGSDVAAIATEPQDVGGTRSQMAISIKDFANAKDLYEGGTVIVLGYPAIVGGEYLIRAIVRGGIVAWRDPKDPFGRPFLIDANIYPGNSGGPVIKVPVGLSELGASGLPTLPYLLGIVSQAPGQMQDISLTVPGVVLPLRLRQTIPLGGTGVIVPASKISELLHSLAGK